MLQFVEITNPFRPECDKRVTTVAGATTIRTWLESRFPGFVEFPQPTLCLCNGVPLMRKDWGRCVDGDDTVVFVPMPGEMATWAWYLVAILAGIGVGLLVPVPKYNNQGTSESVYTIRGQQNQVRLGDPVEVVYGRCRVWPSYGALPYNRFINNDQWQFALFCIGQGEYDIERIQIEDTSIDNFQEVEYAVYKPGEYASLFDDNVQTSSEVSNLELLGTNEAEYGWAGPFAVNEAGTRTDRFEVDFALPMGLYKQNSSGGLDKWLVTFEVEWREIDDSGAPLGDWQSSVLMQKRLTLSTTKAQRVTYSQVVAAGRWEVRARRTNEKDTSTSVGNLLHWACLRAFLPSTRLYPGKTMLALKMRATNNLNDTSAFRINAWVTRKLPVWSAETETWSAPTATRSLVWALCDVLKSSYGGQVSDAYLPLTDYVELDAAFTAAGRYFDFVFDTRMTVWEAARTILRVGRAVPMLEGSLVNIIRDTQKTLATAVFNPHNIVKDTFKLELVLPKDGEYDGVSVTYTDPADFLPRTIPCLVDDDLGDNLEEVKLLGCTSRDWAYREGMYYRACKKYLRTKVTFTTGTEGHIPRFGSLVAVGHDTPRWSTHGFVRSVAVDKRTLTLSEPVAFTEGLDHYIGLRTDNGEATSPLLCTEGDMPTEVVLDEDLPAEVSLAEGVEPPVYLFGTSDTWSKLCLVVSTKPDSSGDTVTLELTVYDPRVYAHDNGTAPSDGTYTPPYPSAPFAPALNCSLVTFTRKPNSSTVGLLTFEPTLGATKYEVETSLDAGITWQNHGVSEDFQRELPLPIREGIIEVRVRPIGAGIGDWCEHSYSFTEETVPLDPWQKTPGTYIDLLVQTGVLTMPTGLLNFSTANSSYTLSGWKEFVPSVPPRAFLTATPSGDWTRFYNDGTSIHFSEYQGDMTVVAATGLTASSGASYFMKASWGGSGSRYPYGTGAGLDPRVAGQLDPAYTSNHSGAHSTQRSDSWASTDYYAEFNGVWYSSRMYQGAYGVTLKDEDTEQAAILRSPGLSWSEWSAASPVVSSSARGANQYSGNATIGKYKGNFTGATPNWTYKLTMAVQDRVIGAPSWETAAPIELSLTADGEGNIMVEEAYLYPENGHEKKIVSQTWSYTP